MASVLVCKSVRLLLAGCKFASAAAAAAAVSHRPSLVCPHTELSALLEEDEDGEGLTEAAGGGGDGEAAGAAGVSDDEGDSYGVAMELTGNTTMTTPAPAAAPAATKSPASASAAAAAAHTAQHAGGQEATPDFTSECLHSGVQRSWERAAPFEKVAVVARQHAPV